MHKKFWLKSLKRLFRRPMFESEDNIKIYLKAVVPNGLDWINLAQDRNGWLSPVNMLMELLVS
jgi:hypothetical protein